MSEQKNQNVAPEQEAINVSQQQQVRLEKLKQLQAEGNDPFLQTRFDWDHTSTQIKENYDALEDDFHKYEIGKDVPAKNGDFGKKWEGIKHVYNRSLHFLFKECGIDGVFAGHLHKNNFSVLHDGIRYTFGLKTGLFDYLDEEALGGTLITVQKDCFTVKHIYFNKSKGE